MNSMNERSELNSLNPTNDLNELNAINDMNELNSLNAMNQSNRTYSTNELSPLSPLNPINDMNELNELNELNPLKPLNPINDMNHTNHTHSINDSNDVNSIHSTDSTDSETVESVAEPLRFASHTRLSLIELVATRFCPHSQELLSSRRSQGFEPSQVPLFHLSHSQLRSPRLSVGSPRLRDSTPRLLTGPMGAATVRSDGVSFFHSVDSPPPRNADTRASSAGMESSRRLARLRERGKEVREFGYRANEVKKGGKCEVGAVQVPNAAAESDEQRGARDDALCRWNGARLVCRDSFSSDMRRTAKLTICSTMCGGRSRSSRDRRGITRLMFESGAESIAGLWVRGDGIATAGKHPRPSRSFIGRTERNDRV